MTEFRFPPFKLPESAEVEARLSGAREAGGSEFRFAPVELAEPARREARPPAAQDPVAAEFRFPPLRLSEPTGSNGTPAPARTGSACCANCDRGLPCASGAGGCSAGKERLGAECPSPGTGECAEMLRVGPKSPPPLASEPPLPGGTTPPFWKPMDVEVNLKPMRLCCPKDDPDKQGCDQSWPSCEDLDDDTGSTPRPTSYCGPIPPELDEWEPCPENRDHFCDNNSYRCALTSCNDAITSCAPLVTGKYSAKSHTQPVFSYSKWKGGYLESLPTSPDDPPYGLADCSLIRAIAYHIDQTQSGDEVLIAIAGWSDVAWVIARAVELAKKRGVTVRAISGGGTGIVDWASTGPWVKGVLEDSLGSDFKHWKSADEHKPFKWQISHNKFVLIHKKASNQHMVLITGANWARFDIARNCDLLTLESKPIWSAFRIYWLELFAASSAYSAMYASEFSDPQRGLTVLFWPVLGGDWLPHPDGKTGPGNPFYKIVNKYKKQAGTKIRIICSAWDEGAPGKGLLRELKLHKKAGSDVRVIGNHLLDRGCHAVSGCKKQPNTPKSQDVGSCETTNFIWDNLDMETADGPPIPWAKCAPHSKVLLVSGIQTEDNKFHQAVYTGSLNISPLWTMPDALVGVHDDPLIFSQYEEWWKWLCSNTAMNKGGSVSVCGPLPKKGKKG